MSNGLMSEIQRQEKYLSELPKDFKYPLFNTKRALESQRQNGYRNTAVAAREIIDNGFEAGATKVHVVFESVSSRGRDIVKSVAMIDNGSGMIPPMARFSLSWGGGTHFDDPNFIGKFGFGLPNASINQTKQVEVYTRTSKKEPLTRAWLDLDAYKDYGQQSVPEPEIGATEAQPSCIRTALHLQSTKQNRQNRRAKQLHASALCGGQNRVLALLGAPLLPRHQHRRGDGNRRIRADQDAHHQRKREAAQHLAAEDVQR